MVRSFQYAAEGALRSHLERGMGRPEDVPALAARGRLWQLWVTTRYLAGYLAEADGDVYVPTDEDDVGMLLRAFLLDKALYEVRYDLSHRPHWAGIPLAGILQLLGS
jgi:maltose alpha-D-glucosyltransferase/alpha-amylase